MTGAGRHLQISGIAVDGSHASVGVRNRQHIKLLRNARLRDDHQRAEQPAGHLWIRDLMGVVPIGPCLISNETVGEVTAHRHSILGHSGDTVHGIRNIDSVPVQRDTVGH